MTPPPTEKSQNALGTMLRRARSLAIHWTTKRAENRAWPRKPTSIQIEVALIISLHAPSGEDYGGGG